jgi:hypothetical protein
MRSQQHWSIRGRHTFIIALAAILQARLEADWLSYVLQEFRRLQSALGAAKDRAELFAGSSEASPMQVQLLLIAMWCNPMRVVHMKHLLPTSASDILKSQCPLQASSSAGLLLRERGNLQNSHSAVGRHACSACRHPR